MFIFQRAKDIAVESDHLCLYRERWGNMISNQCILCDVDNSGTISFSEWCTCTMDKKKIMTQKRLISTFKMFDKDNNGTISSEEI